MREIVILELAAGRSTTHILEQDKQAFLLQSDFSEQIGKGIIAPKTSADVVVDF